MLSKALPQPAGPDKALQGECDCSLPSGIFRQATVKKGKPLSIQLISKAAAV